MNDQTLENRIATTFKLTPKLAKMLTGLYTRTYLRTNEVDQVLMHHLRKEIKPRGITIHTRRRFWYCIYNEGKDIIRQVIGEGE